MGEDVIEVKPEVIDAPARRTAIDDLVERAARLEDAINRGDTYGPHEITSAADYKQSKNERKALRKDIKAITDERASLFRRVEEQKQRIHDALVPANEADEEYKRRIAEWERTCVDSRTQEVAAWYAETQGDVAAMVPFETVWARYAHAEKWDLYGANLVAIEGEVAEIVEHVISRDLETIGGMGYEPQDAEALRAEYLRTLDFDGSCRRIQALREQRDRMAEAERARRERMAAEAGPGPVTDATEGPQEAASAPEEPAPGQAPTASATGRAAAACGAAPAAPGRVMVFRVTVPEERAREFVAAMRRIPGVHGGPWHDERTSE